MAKTLSVKVEEIGERVSARLEIPKGARALFVFAHGAGAGMDHAAMNALSEALLTEKVAVFRYQFPYMEKKFKRPDSPKVATATVAAAVEVARQKAPELPIFAGGKSFGGRMTTQAAALGLIDVKGIICFAFPLHPPKKEGVERAEHLAKVTFPILFIQGTRDALCEMALMRSVMARFPRRFKLHVLEGADHSFTRLKSFKHTTAEAVHEAAVAAREFCASIKRG